MELSRLQYLLKRYVDDNASQDEKSELLTMLESENAEDAESVIVDEIEITGEPSWSEERLEYMVRNVLDADKTNTGATVIRMKPAKRGWIKYAAAAAIILGIGIFVWNIKEKEEPSVTKVNPLPLKNDVMPGGDKAVLTLADGRKIVLDSVANGIVAKQGDITIEKDNSKIIYPSLREGQGVGSKAYAVNNITTPRGGQYQITLSDGTKVWLNAESSITYPTAFTERERERRVSITGEAYFEVAKDKTKPFKVLVEKNYAGPGVGSKNLEGSNNLEIEVLGTHFNINSYKEEPTINTTLIEGSVKLTSKKNVHTSLTLKPGQQGQMNAATNDLSLAAHPDVDKVMAWRNGLFNFNNVSLKEAMTQIQRWYDVEVVYEKEIPNITFGGMIGRDLNLSQVLKVLKTAGVKFRIEDKKVIVTP